MIPFESKELNQKITQTLARQVERMQTVMDICNNTCAKPNLPYGKPDKTMKHFPGKIQLKK